MKLFTVAAFSLLAGFTFAAEPYPCQLSQEQAEDIVYGYSSILKNETYKGKPPVENYKVFLSDNYVEISDSILALMSRNNTLGVQKPAAVGRETWFKGVSQYPVPKIINREIMVANGQNVLWYFTFDGIGPPLPTRVPVTGFSLLRIDENLQIYEADIEFNSIAWGNDVFELQQWCK